MALVHSNQYLVSTVDINGLVPQPQDISSNSAEKKHPCISSS